jgi:hypothetical protein
LDSDSDSFMGSDCSTAFAFSLPPVALLNSSVSKESSQSYYCPSYNSCSCRNTIARWKRSPFIIKFFVSGSIYESSFLSACVADEVLS